jgi:hypothetical protein
MVLLVITMYNAVALLVFLLRLSSGTLSRRVSYEKMMRMRQSEAKPYSMSPQIRSRCLQPLELGLQHMWLIELLPHLIAFGSVARSRRALSGRLRDRGRVAESLRIAMLLVGRY